MKHLLKLGGLTPEEIDVQYDMWRSYVATHIPPPYDGLRPILTRWKQEGGLLCVSSHSARENILRDYRLHFDLEPDQIFDWDLGEDRRKPCRRSCGCMTCVRMSY